MAKLDCSSDVHCVPFRAALLVRDRYVRKLKITHGTGIMSLNFFPGWLIHRMI